MLTHPNQVVFPELTFNPIFRKKSCLKLGPGRLRRRGPQPQFHQLLNVGQHPRGGGEADRLPHFGTQSKIRDADSPLQQGQAHQQACRQPDEGPMS